MGLDLAKDQIYLERTKLRYVNLPNILSDALYDRRARVDGVVGVVLGQISYWIFMRGGEPVNALKREPGRPAVSLPVGEVVRLAQRGDDHGQVFYYGASERQLRAMFATTGPVLEAADAVDASDAVAFFGELRRLRLDAVLELETPTALHYLVLRGGEVSEAYLAGLPRGASRSEFLRSLLEGDAWRRCKVRAYAPVEELPVQAGPGLARLYRGVMERTLKRLSGEIGAVRAREALEAARAQAAAAHPLLASFSVEHDRVVGEPVAAAEELTAAVADWFLGALREAERRGLDSPADVAEIVTESVRLALSEQGFLARLPWPLAV